MSRFNPIHKRAWLTDNVKSNFSLNLYVCDNSGPFSDQYFILTAVSKVLLKILGLTAMLRGSDPSNTPLFCYKKNILHLLKMVKI